MVGMSISISSEAVSKMESRMKVTNKNRSEYIESLILQDYNRSPNSDLDAGKTYAQVIEDAERRLSELRAAEEKNKAEDMKVMELQAWFETHDQPWRDAIINRFMDGNAVFAKNYWDVVKVQKVFEERYKTIEFYWKAPLTELEYRQLIQAALKPVG